MSQALLFSGQGSQYVGMGKDLYANSEYAREMFSQADEILGYSLQDICFEGPLEVLKETRYTQPALFVHEMILFALCKNHLSFSAVAGHSLGEYSALCASGVLSFNDALRLVSLRGNLMFEIGVEIPGAMAAIIGLDDTIVIDLCLSLTEKSVDGQVLVAANFNSPGQVVISGSSDLLRSSLQAFKDAGARMVTELPVSGAFHSPLMQPAKEKLAKAIYNTTFCDTEISVYCNVTGQFEQSPIRLQENLIRQLDSAVLWTQTMINMNANGITSYIEIGPKNVLQGLVKRTLTSVSISGIDTYNHVQSIVDNQQI